MFIHNFQKKEWRNNTKYGIEHASLKEASVTIAEKMERQNATSKGAKIEGGYRIERTNPTWKGAQLTNGEHRERTSASWKEANMTYGEYGKKSCSLGKGKCQMQHTWKQQINLHKVANPAQKTRDTAPGCQFVRRSAEREGSDLNWGPSNLDILCERPQKN